MTAWVLEILNNPHSYPMFSVTGRWFGGSYALARVEWFDWSHRGGQRVSGHFRGVTLYEPSRESAPLAEGVDVSHFQGSIDWERVAESGKVFALIKGTEGASLVDATFAANWVGAKESGVLRGAYHLFRAKEDPRAQAELFLSHLSPRGELPIALNVESANGLTSEDVAERIAQWVEYVASNYERPLLYVSPHFWDTLPKRGIEANTDLCVSEWDVSEPAAISGWNSWSFWQYSSSTEVPGIRASVHLARFNGTVDELHRYLTRRNAPALVRSLDLSTITGIQQALNQLGCRPALVVDGVAGNKTRAAIESFQHATNLDVDGCAGEATQRALQQALSELNPNE